MIDDSCVELRIEVHPSPETNDYEVRLLADGENLINRFGPGHMGLDPDDLLRNPCALRAEYAPRYATIGRCTCGVIGCGSLWVEVQREGEFVVWRSYDRSQSIRFFAAQYDKELDRALGDFSWETPDRTAARLIFANVDRAMLERTGFTLDWVFGRHKEGLMTVSLTLSQGPYQVFVSLPWEGRSVQTVVSEFTKLFSMSPQSWPDVTWLPQAKGLDAPVVGGPGWRQFGR